MYQHRKLSDLKKYPGNPRYIEDDDFQRLVNSVRENPEYFEARPLILSDRTGELIIIAGNQRYEAAKIVGYETVPTYLIPNLTEQKEKEVNIRDNVSNGKWDYNELMENWSDLPLDEWMGEDWQPDPSSGEGNGDAKVVSLQDRFVVPPFSILDTRKGYWQERKKAWSALIGDRGESRNDTLISSLELKYKDLYGKSAKKRKQLGVSFKEYIENHISPEELKKHEKTVLSRGVSVLDPVLAEIAVKWFCPMGGKTFDPFAGDTVFGFVSAYLGYEFTGIELRAEQAEINNSRVAGMPARYINDDGQSVGKHILKNSQDLLFSCPPYFDLEVYSDHENDASNQDDYFSFMKILENAFASSIKCLGENRFAVIVVGDVRDKKTGTYYDFPGDIKRHFSSQGMSLYNELILVETGASTAIRAGRYMESRKVAKMHQNVLVFYKGDTRTIKTNFHKINYEIEDLEFFRLDSGNGSSED